MLVLKRPTPVSKWFSLTHSYRGKSAPVGALIYGGTASYSSLGVFPLAPSTVGQNQNYRGLLRVWLNGVENLGNKARGVLPLVSLAVKSGRRPV